MASGRPLPAEIYPVTEARAAFRRMQQARHIGKIVPQVPKPLTPTRSDLSDHRRTSAPSVCTRRRTWPNSAPGTLF